jgi:hypothetical protein
MLSKQQAVLYLLVQDRSELHGRKIAFKPVSFVRLLLCYR